jgi:hypothetical protein
VPARPAGEARARSLVELRRWPEARDVIAGLLAEDPDRPSLHGLMCQAQLGLKQHMQAVESAKRLVALQPDGEWGHRLLSIALLDSRHRSAAAVQAAQEAVRLAPHKWETHQTLAQALMGTTFGGTTRARPAAERAVELAPHEPLAHFTLGLVAQRLGDLDAARGSYREALRLDPQNASALNNLAVIESKHRFGRQLRGYAAALRADPQGEVAKDNLVVVTHNMIRRLYRCGVAVMVAGVVLTGFGTIGPNVASITAGILTVVALGVVLRVYVRATSRGVRRHVMSQVGRNDRLNLAIVSTVAAFGFGLAFCFVPGAAHGALTHGLFSVFLVIAIARLIASAIRSNQQR